VDRIHRVDVFPRPGETPRDLMLGDIEALGIHSVTRVERSDVYFLQGGLSSVDVAAFARVLLADPVVQSARCGTADEAFDPPDGAIRVEVGLLPGVTDSVADNLMQRAALMGIAGLEAAASAESYLIYGQPSMEEVQEIARRLLYNDVIQYYQVGWLDPHVGSEAPSSGIAVESVPILDMNDEQLLEVSRDRLFSLDLFEMRAVQAYYRETGREPTDVEMESLAQTWSEHCVHKTFRGVIDYREEGANGTHEERIDSLIKTYLQAATLRIDKPWVLSAFVDNAGIIAFDGGYEISFKAETHNHPSALEPFGGANTGVGGVVRDIIGVSARPIANTDVLCFGELDTPLGDLPAGVLHPRRIYSGVVSGVEDYGNKMGIPTVNGAILFEPGYTANPLVYCGCVGISPEGLHRSQAQPGDLVIVLGGRTGRDGLHGATFSSIELTDETGETSGGAVQIGNPITEKMTLDAILVARDEGLYTAITDCGAGGLSSAVSEMGEKTGVTVQLEKVPLKYVGLRPWEIWVSEAQERMVIAVPQQHEARLRGICDGYSVEMTVIGRFRGDGQLLLRYGDDTVADLTMAFLHDGLPRRYLSASWTQPERPATAWPELSGAEMGELLLSILAHPNIRSKEDVVRRYDHEVQGGTVIKPFVGVADSGPSDAAVLKPLEVADSWAGVALGCAINPAYGAIDPYEMAVSAIDEAVRNVVCVGGDPDRIAILDNFCWGNPNLPDRLGGLVRACKGCYDGAVHYGTPFVSGKDSLNNEYTDGTTGKQVSIPPSLLISAIGIVPDVRHVCSMDLKAPNNLIYLVGATGSDLGGSYGCRLLGIEGHSVPGIAPDGPAIARALFRAIQGDLVESCHDCSEGGLAVALAEMALAGMLGLDVTLDKAVTVSDTGPGPEWLLFSESNGRYLIEVSPGDAAAFEDLLAGLPYARIGRVLDAPDLSIRWTAGGDPLFSLPVSTLATAWRGHLSDSGGDGGND